MTIQDHDIQRVVTAVLAAQAQQQPAPDIDAVVMKAIATILTSFGISDDDRFELRADFIHLRKWRKSVDAATGLTLKIIVTTIVTGLLGALGVGLKAWIGK